MILPGIRALQKYCRAYGQVLNGTREVDLQAKLEVHSTEINPGTQEYTLLMFSKWILLTRNCIIKCDEFYFWFSAFTTAEVSDDYRNWGWQAGMKRIHLVMGLHSWAWGQHPTLVLLQGKVSKAGMLSAISFCFASSPTSSSTSSMLQSHLCRHKAKESQGRKFWGWAAEPDCCSAICPFPWHLTSATLEQNAREDLESSWQKTSGWRNNIAPSYVASSPCEKEETAQVPPLTTVQYPKGCGTRHLQETSPHFWP